MSERFSASPNRCPYAALHADVSVPVGDRAFADPEQTRRDHAIMTCMLRRVKQTLMGYEEPVRVRIQEPEHREHQVIIVNPLALRRGRKFIAVGFFGRMQPGAEHRTLADVQRVDEELIDDFKSFDGLLSYSTFQIEDDRYGNMPIFRDRKAMELWRVNQRHTDAVRMFAAHHYASIRLHICTIRGSILSTPKLHIDVTKYYEYQGDQVWAAVRDSCTGVIERTSFVQPSEMPVALDRPGTSS